MSDQRFWCWSVGRNQFTAYHYADDVPPYVVLECIECEWRSVYPELEPSKRYWLPDSFEHEKKCEHR